MNQKERIDDYEERIIKALDYNKCMTSLRANLSAITSFQQPAAFCQKYAENQWHFEHCFLRPAKCDMEAILHLAAKK